MEAKKILSADFLDILFEGKNKDYGAYDLRKSYSSRLVKALAGTFFIVLIFSMGFSFAKSEEDISTIIIDDHAFGEVPKEKDPVIIPPTPKEPEAATQPKEVNQVNYSTIVIKDNDKIKPESIINTITDQTAISTKTVITDFTKPVVNAPISDVGTTTGLGNILAKVENPDTIFLKVEKEAEFPGGQIAWRRFLTNKLDAQEPLNNGAKPGRYIVVIKFVVSKTGELSNFAAETNLGYGMEEEAIRVIKKSMAWKPAIQNGNIVNAYRRQPIIFEVNDY